MKGKLLTKVCSGALALAMLMGASVLTEVIPIGTAESTGIVANAASTNYNNLFNVESSSYQKINNGDRYLSNTVNVKKIKLYVVGNYKNLNTSGSNLSTYGSAKYTYNKKDNKTYIVLNFKPKEGKNAVINFSGTVTNNGKKSNFGFSFTYRLDYTYNKTLGKGFNNRVEGIDFNFEQVTQGGYVKSITSSNPNVISIADDRILHALNVGKATIKIKWACGLVKTYNYKVVEGKEYRSSIKLGDTKLEFKNKAQKDIYRMYSVDPRVNVEFTRNGDYKRQYTITSPLTGPDTKQFKTDVYIWYTDGTHSRITVNILPEAL